MNVAKIIIDARRAKGMTQQELADVIGVKQSDIARVESGWHTVRIDRLEKIAHALGIQITIG